MKNTLLLLSICILSANASVLVPGTSNPWLAGMPNGATACGFDSAPNQSPVLVQPLTAGSILTFAVTGSTDHGGPPFGLFPDGGSLQAHASENGISSNNLPISSLVGVFLDASAPTNSAAPGSLAYTPAAGVIKPGLKQVFFIGDGLSGASSGVIQQFVVPPGATRLFLGTQDGCDWNDNGGSFTVNITVYSNSFNVPGRANPWLASSSSACGGDTAPAESPVLVQPITPGTVLTFDVSGSTDHGGSPIGLTPDGGPLQSHGPENGIASNNVPISSLVGVFLDASSPSSTQAPAALPFVPDATVTRPDLKQPFFIGDGRTGTGTGLSQQFVVPLGATRLFLGTQDGCPWLDNGGSFQVAVHPSQDLSPAASIRLSQVEICWDTLSNGTYQVQYSIGVNGIWTNLGSTVAGTGGILCTTDSIIQGQAQRFYRIISVP